MLRPCNMHELKLNIKYADAVCSRRKIFEVRKEDDRHFEEGDLIKFKVVDDEGNNVKHRLNEHKPYQITYILRDFEGLAEGYVVFGIDDGHGRVVFD